MRNTTVIAILTLSTLCVFGGELQPVPNEQAVVMKRKFMKLMDDAANSLKHGDIENAKLSFDLAKSFGLNDDETAAKEKQVSEMLRAVADQRQRERPRPNDQQPRDNRDDGRRDDGRQNVMPKVHAKLADGTELEIDGPLLMMPGLGQQLLDRIMDPAKDGILTFRLDRDLEQGFNLENLKASVQKVAPHVSMEILWIGGGILVVTSDSVGELRKALVVIRATKQQQMPGQPPGPPPGERMQRPRPDGDQPKRERKDDPPGQF